MLVFLEGKDLGRVQQVCAILRHVLTFDLLGLLEIDFIILLVPLDVRLESLPLAISHQDSNFRVLLWNPY